MNWTQPVCEDCWRREHGERRPFRMKDREVELEKCCLCGALTTSGIYVRQDPALVPFPDSGDVE